MKFFTISTILSTFPVGGKVSTMYLHVAVLAGECGLDKRERDKELLKRLYNICAINTEPSPHSDGLISFKVGTLVRGKSLALPCAVPRVLSTDGPVL